MSDTQLSRELWQLREMDPKMCLQYDIGPLTIWIWYVQHDWYVGNQIRADGLRLYRVRSVLPDDVPKDLAWRRWTSSRESLHVRVAPLLPDRPLVVKPDSEIKIPAGNRALFFVSIPLWFRVIVGASPGEVTLTEVPSAVLSNSWFGDVTSGELCYSLLTKATREVDVSEVMLHRATCPVHIHNNSPNTLDFIRLCVHGEHLRLYEGQNRLYTNHVKVTFRGEDQLSQIELVKTAPDIEPGCRMMQPARIPADHSIMKRTFQVLRSLTGV